MSFDFYIPKKYRGDEINLSGFKPIRLTIPPKASYLNVNPLEDENEFLGNQDESDYQELRYYDNDEIFISVDNLENKIKTGRLMNQLENIFNALY